MREKLADPWRVMCPQHHHDLVDQQGPTVYCRQCGHASRCDLVANSAFL